MVKVESKTFPVISLKSGRTDLVFTKTPFGWIRQVNGYSPPLNVLGDIVILLEAILELQESEA